MMKVLVAEDERPILRNIVKAIEAADPDFNVKYTAFNGKQAKEYLDTQQIDVAFLDINMPIYDGLFLLQYICDNNIDLILVILTGYREFDYAKKALKYNAFDYLLKPLDEKELGNLLNKLKVEVEIKKKKLPFDSCEKISRNVFEDEGGMQNICFVASCFLGGCSGGSLSEETKTRQEDTERYLRKYIEEQVEKNRFWLAKGHLDSERILFLNGNTKQYRELLEGMISHADGSLLPITVVSSTGPVRISEINTVYQNLSDLAKERMEFGKSSILFPEKKQQQEGGIDKARLEAVLDGIQPGITKDMLVKVFGRVIELAGTKRKYLEYGMKSFFLRLCEKVPAQISYLDIEEEIVLILENEFEYNKLIEKTESVVKEYFYVSVEPSKNRRGLAEELKKYIMKSYQFPFSSQILEERFGYSAFYLRSVFKEAFGMSPNEFLLKVRMDKACLLLKQGIQAKDVASEVGFSDPLYFSKVFKKFTGSSPSECMGDVQSRR